MAYRDDDEALEAKLRSLGEAREVLDAEIAQTIDLLRPHREAARRARERTARRVVGMTFGVALVAAILVVLVAVCSPLCRHRHGLDVQVDAQTLRSAATMYTMENGRCPQPRALVDGGYLDASRRSRDRWDRPFAIRCHGDDIDVGSAGADGEWGTKDDWWSGRTRSKGDGES